MPVPGQEGVAIYTGTTYQDWLASTDHLKLMQQVIVDYKSSSDFTRALEADEYFHAQNRAVSVKVILRANSVTREEAVENGKRVTKVLQKKEVPGNRIYSNFFFRFVTQQNQYLLGNGVTLDDAKYKARLGAGFDKALEKAGEKALLHGVCWGYWNADHMEIIPAESDALSGAVALLDERTGAPGVFIQFWQMDVKRPMYVRLFELDGLTEYRTVDGELVEYAPKRPYLVTTVSDAAGSYVKDARNYGQLPIVPFYASDTKRSEFSPAIKSKIDLYDRILSDFGDNLDKANDVYWVLNNFGGTTDEVLEMLQQIEQIRAVVNYSDGTGSGSTAEPRSFEVPYTARQTALQLLEKALYQDYMALSMTELTGGSLTNVAIETAMTNLNLKADRFEWQAFQFVQSMLKLVGIETESIRFQRQVIANKSEIVQDIALMREYIDDATALKLNPYILQEDIESILDNKAAEQVSGLPSVAQLQKALDGDA